MRMRKKKHGAERLESCREKGLVITSAEDIPASFIPAALEIGCGKGSFITGMAKRFPEKNFIALEKISDVVVIAAERILAENITNVKLINMDAKNIDEYFGPGSISEIYLNFPDPWPKKGHFKRRLTYREYLELYKSRLNRGGAIFFKTDNAGLFDYSLEQFTLTGFRLENITRDLQSSEFAAGNIVTEYETIFSEKGFKICRVEAYYD